MKKDLILEGKSLRTPSTKKLVLAAFFLALGILLPLLMGPIPQVGRMLLPMHLPILICGFVCGWPFGLAVGFITPLLGSVLLGMPPMYPVAVAMAFELAAYGFATGLLYKLLMKKVSTIYVTLILSMIAGRIVWSIAMIILLGLSGGSFTWAAFMSGAFINALPGIILQIVLIPIIIIALQKARLIENG